VGVGGVYGDGGAPGGVLEALALELDGLPAHGEADPFFGKFPFVVEGEVCWELGQGIDVGL
jgi:hypothetical protein